MSVTYTVDGRDYRPAGWFGCQLKSVEYRRVQTGDVRVIAGFPMFAWKVRAKPMFRCEISWCLVSLPPNAEAAKKRIRKLYDSLSRH